MKLIAILAIVFILALTLSVSSVIGGSEERRHPKPTHRHHPTPTIVCLCGNPMMDTPTPQP